MCEISPVTEQCWNFDAQWGQITQNIGVWSRGKFMAGPNKETGWLMLKCSKTPNFLIFFFFYFLWPHLQHMEISRLGVQSELQLPAYTTATAMPDLSLVCDLHHSLWQCWILNPLSKARDQTCVLMHTTWVHSRNLVVIHWATVGTPPMASREKVFFFFFAFLSL